VNHEKAFTGIQEMSVEDAVQRRNELTDLLVDAVESGASLGFLPPLVPNAAASYWESVLDAMRAGDRVLIVASNVNSILGAVQLALETRVNGNHRAEVMKLMVPRLARGRGLGRELMRHAEEAARRRARTLLVLDTRRGDAAEQLYSKLGYQRAGVIPRYARSASGELHDTVFMYWEI
jgi:ribosomal protein S18 acetylase RimI-like enzyme